jgi:glycosyltransferase involved in cell wall biosynthesis
VKSCIWYISKYAAPPNKAGVGVRGYLIMRELAHMGYRTVIVTSDSNHHLTAAPKLEAPYLFEEVEGIQLCWVRTMKFSVAKSLRRILSWLDFEWRLWRLPKERLPAPDAVIVSSLSLLTILNGFLLRRRYKCRLVLEIRDIWPLTITEVGGFSRWNPVVLSLGVIEKLGYRHADAVVGTMPNLGEHVAKVLGYSKATYCIPMGVDDAALTPGDEVSADYVEKYIPQDKFIVAYAGTIGINNSLGTMFKCAESMLVDPRVHFLVLGEGALREDYQRRYAHLTNLTFAPRVPKQMVQSVLSRCDLLHFSVPMSVTWKYGQSLNKLIDYMLAGKPIVASYSGYPSMINEADCGTYVPAGDPVALRREICRYAEMDAAQRESIGQRGREWLLANRRYGNLAADYLRILFNHQTVDQNNEAFI